MHPSLLAFVVAAGCAFEGTPRPPEDPLDPPDPVGLGPVATAPVGGLRGFALVTVGTPGRRPVVAFLPGGDRVHAYIDAASGRPVVGGDGVVPTVVEGDGQAASLTMVASQDGGLHLAWSESSSTEAPTVRAARLDADDGTLWGPWTLGLGRDPSIAVAPDGEVVVGWVEDVPHHGVPVAPRIFVARGRTAGTFGGLGPPEHLNEGCCTDELGEVAYTASGPSLAIDAGGSIHVVYEWMTPFATVVEYLHGSERVEITRAAFAPCPSIVLDGDAVDIVYLREGDSHVWATRIEGGVAGEARPLYESGGYLTMAMSVLDPAGVLHVAVTEYLSERMILRYVGGGAPVVIADVARPALVDLTPTAGGAAIAPDGTLAFAFIEADSMESTSTARARLALGR